MAFGNLYNLVTYIKRALTDAKSSPNFWEFPNDPSFLFGVHYPTPNFPANSHQLNSNSPQENISKKNMPTSTVKRIVQKLKSTTKRQTSSSTSSNSDQSKSSKKVINNCPAPSNSSVNNSRAMLSESP